MFLNFNCNRDLYEIASEKHTETVKKIGKLARAKKTWNEIMVEIEENIKYLKEKVNPISLLETISYTQLIMK